MLKIAAVLALAAAACCAYADNASKGQSMKMDEPMYGEMKKKGMKRGDVRKAAEKKERAMKPMMEEERKAMMGGGAKQ